VLSTVWIGTRHLRATPQAMLSGDAINHPAQLQQPELATGPDEDAEGAMQVRRMLLAELVDSDRTGARAFASRSDGSCLTDRLVDQLGPHRVRPPGTAHVDQDSGRAG